MATRMFPGPRTGPAPAIALALLLLAGQGRAGESAWVGTYREVRDGKACEFTLVRGDRRAETRGCDRPTRIWRRLDDGVELLELHPGRGELVRYSPGDLRAARREPDWSQASGLVSDTLRHALGAGRPVRTGGREALRYDARDPSGRRVRLDWLAEAGVPARYRVGDRRGGETLELRALARIEAREAFTALEGLREVDWADLGD